MPRCHEPRAGRPPAPSRRRRSNPSRTPRGTSGSAGRIRSAPPTTARAPTSRCSPSVAEARRAVPVRPPRARRRHRHAVRGAHRPDRGRRLLLARLPARRRGPASATATACTGRGTRPTGSGATRPSCCSTRTPRPIDGEVDWDAGVLRLRLRRPGLARTPPTARRTCRPAVVGDPFFDWGNDRARRHTRCTRRSSTRPTSSGLTHAPPGRAAEELRGTYAGLAHPAVIDHLTRLGVTAVELMPVHQFVHDHHLVERGLRNYWGYNSIAFFAPHNGYADRSGQASRCRSSRRWCKALHGAGIEVILDVVYNHTAEGNHLGPTLSLRGIDNPAYYRLIDDDARYYLDFTGTGNSLNMRHPHVLQLIMDSLRYWVTEMHVDGFRFDLAVHAGPRAARRRPAVGVLRPHPAGPGRVAGEADRRAVGRRRGRLPGRQLPAAVVGVERPLPRHGPRLLARRAGDAGRVRRRASPAAPTSTRPTPAGRRQRSTSSPPTTASRSHDLVSYNEKHNEANGEDNRDGESHNRSWNCGVEGPTDDPDVLDALRARQRRNFAGHAAAVAGRADAARRRRDRPHPAGQQQRLLPGQRDLVVRLGPTPTTDVPRVVPRLVTPCAATTRCSAAAAGSRAARSAASEDVALAAPRRRGDDRRRLGRPATPGRVGVFLNGDAITDRPTPTAGGSPTTASSCCSTPARSTCRGSCRRRCGRGRGSSSSTATAALEPGTELAADATVTIVHRSLAVLRSPRPPATQWHQLERANHQARLRLDRTDRRRHRSRHEHGRRAARRATTGWTSYWDNQGRYHESDPRDGAGDRRGARGRRRDRPAAHLAPVDRRAPGEHPVGDGVDQVHLTLADGTTLELGCSTARSSFRELLPIGSHQLSLAGPGLDESTTVVVAPRAMPTSATLAGRTGLFVPAYALWEQRLPAAVVRATARRSTQALPGLGVDLVATLPLYAGVPRRAVRSEPVRAGQPAALERGVHRRHRAAASADVPPMGDLVDWQVLARRRRRQLLDVAEALAAGSDPCVRPDRRTGWTSAPTSPTTPASGPVAVDPTDQTPAPARVVEREPSPRPVPRRAPSW